MKASRYARDMVFDLPLALATISVVLATNAASGSSEDSIFSIPRRDTPILDPLVAEVAASDRDGLPLRLVLLDHAGAVLGESAPLEAGEIDLRRRIPEIDRLERAAWLQAIVGDEPVGSAWVVVPLRDRPTLRTMTALRPDGQTEYTRVVGWGDTPLEPVDEDVREAAETWEPSARPIMGFRCHREMDVVLETEFGDLVVALRPDEAPNTARNFRELAAAGFYDGTIVHRIVPLDREGRPFVIQGGDPTGAGEGGPGYTIPFERTGLGHDFGVISMARDDDPDSAGSQWFIGLSRDGTARLDGQYAAFGEVVEGAAVIVEIAGVRLADVVRGRPESPPVVRRASLRPAPSRRPDQGRPDGRVGPVSVLPPTPPTERPSDPGR
jgi:peptidyl-prolyl cis-trans isomerase B (cyclophilin B)